MVTCWEVMTYEVGRHQGIMLLGLCSVAVDEGPRKILENIEVVFLS